MKLTKVKNLTYEIEDLYCNYCQERLCNSEKVNCDVRVILDIIEDAPTLTARRCKDCDESCIYTHTQNGVTETLRYCNYIENTVRDDGWCVPYKDGKKFK